MSPSVALFVWIVFLAALLWFDPAKVRSTSGALWVPVFWMLIQATRLPSQWLNPEAAMVISVQGQQEGNSTDRLVYIALILLAFAFLAARRFLWGRFIQQNLALTLFLSFCLLSVFWSEFPFVAFKRWVRDMGDYAVLLVILSDPRPLDAVRITLRRLCYVTITLSVMLVKYFPALAIQYDPWTGAPEYVGAATSKNMLGAVCLISGLVLCWDMLLAWPKGKTKRIKLFFAVNATIMAMMLWLLHLSRSATSQVCLALGCIVIITARTQWARRHLRLFKFLLPASFFFYLILNFVFDMNGQMAAELGRNPTLTGRTLIWKTLLSLHTNPLLGTGYDNFWLGPRLQSIWQQFGHINEAHNGYLDVYLNLGLAGLVLLTFVIVSAYRNLCRGLDRRSEIAILGVAFWTILLFYSVTEAAFLKGMIWMTMILGTLVVPRAISSRAQVKIFSSNSDSSRALSEKAAF